VWRCYHSWTIEVNDIGNNWVDDAACTGGSLRVFGTLQAPDPPPLFEIALLVEITAKSAISLAECVAKPFGTE